MQPSSLTPRADAIGPRGPDAAGSDHPATSSLWPAYPDAADHRRLFDRVAGYVSDHLNVRSILSDKAIIALLSLASMLPMMSGRVDLTVGYGIVLWHILAIGFRFNSASRGRSPA